MSLEKDDNIQIVSLWDFFEKFLKLIRSSLIGLTNRAINIVIYSLKICVKHYIIFLIGIIIGTGMAFWKTRSNTYETEFWISLNYDFNLELYSKIEYYKSLIEDEKLDVLSSELELEKSMIVKIVDIEIEPLVARNEQVNIYNTYLKLVDTSFSVPMPFETYVSDIQDFQYNNQKIVVMSSDPNIDFSSVQNKMIDIISSDANLIKKQKNVLSSIDREIESRKSITSKLDTIFSTENRVLLNESKKSNSGESQFYLSGQKETKSIEWIFDKYRENYSGIDYLTKHKAEKKEMVTLLRSCGYGVKQSKLLGFIKYGVLGLLLSCVVVAYLELKHLVTKKA